MAKREVRFTVVEADQGSLNELSARADKLRPKVAHLKPGELRWRRNNADTRHRFAGKWPNGQGFVIITEYNPDDLSSTFLRGTRMLAEMNTDFVPLVKQVESEVAEREKRKKKRKKK